MIPTPTTTPTATAIILVPIHDLVSDDPTRLERDEEHINALAADFRQRQKDHPDEHPVQTPLRVVVRGGKYVIVAGNYRYLGGLRAALSHMPCVVLEREMDNADLVIEAASDNEMHRPYTPIERARNILLVRELRQCSLAKAAALLGIKPAMATKLMRVLEHYPADLHPQIGEGDGKVPVTAAYKLTQLHPDEATIRDLTDKVVRGLYSREDLDDKVDELLGKACGKRSKPTTLRTAKGVVLVIPPGFDHDGALTEVACLAESIRWSKRNDLLVANSQQHLRN